MPSTILPFAILSLLLLTVDTASAQTIGNYLGRVEVGVGYGRMDVDSPYPVDSGPRPTRTFEGVALGFGWNWPLVRIVDQLGLGLSISGRVFIEKVVAGSPNDRGPYSTPQPTLPGSYSSSSGGSGLFVSVPIHAMLKYGADAAWGWRQKLGVGLGFGQQYSAREFTIDIGYWTPIVVGEVSYVSPRFIPGVFKLQLIAELGDEVYGSDYETGEELHAGTFSAMLLYTGMFGRRMRESDEVVPPPAE